MNKGDLIETVATVSKKQGIREGMALTAAYALQPNLTVIPRRQSAEKAALARMADCRAAFLRLIASDPENDQLAYSLLTHPTGMSISGSAIRWTPTAQQIGTHQVQQVGTRGEDLGRGQHRLVGFGTVELEPERLFDAAGRCRRPHALAGGRGERWWQVDRDPRSARSARPAPGGSSCGVEGLTAGASEQVLLHPVAQQVGRLHLVAA